jgi:hypothetical protein
MPLSKLQFQPGINRESTSYSNEGGWFDMDKVRFRAGYPEKIGGWTKLGIKSFLGVCRALHSWRTINLDNYLGLGTSAKYYIEEGEGYYDITPIRATTAAGDVTFAATDGSSVITVSDTAPWRCGWRLRDVQRCHILGRYHYCGCAEPRVPHRHHC